ncbi:Corrinoid adenosyltransferase OS=Lysinibacillus sphaericus OT4b.31 OX=1285586 GN=H131_17401 PE=3 SV=1 [Lysinibacillus sphaericus]
MRQKNRTVCYTKCQEEREVPAILFDYLGLLANVFFVMAVYMNQQAGIAEIPFISKSYPMKKKEGE